MAADTKYLKHRGHTWSVVVHVPKKLQEAAGCSEYVKALGTRDVRVAQRLRHTWIAEFKRRIEALRNGVSSSGGAGTTRALRFREMLQRNKGRYSESPDGEVIDEYDEALSELKDAAKAVLEEDGEDAADRFYRLGTGEATLLKDLVPLWSEEHQARLGPDTHKTYHRVLREFLAWAGDSVTIEEVDRRKAGAYVGHLVTATKRAPASVATYLTKLSGFWRWLAEKGFADERNPWGRHRLPRNSTVQRREALSDNELVTWLTFMNGGKYHVLYHDVIRLILVTGLRIEEACQLQPTDLDEREDGYWLIIRQGKTASARREVPLRNEAIRVLKPRLGGHFLFNEIETTGRRRSSVVTGSFGDARQRLGFGKTGQNFHVLRNTFIAAMEGEGVPESTVKLIVGHKRSSLTYGHYSRGQRVDLRDAIQRLRYGDEVMRLLNSEGIARCDFEA